MVSVCLPSEALLQHLPPYLGFSYLGQAAAAGALSAGGCSPEELPHIRGEGQKPGGPHAQRVVAKRSYPTSEVRGGSREELPDIQGKEWQLCFAGAAVKRYPTSKVREIQVRQ